MNPKKQVLAVKDLSVEYRQKVLRQISFEVYKGEILGLVGESGSGKSSLIRAVTGLLNEGGKVTEGEVLFHGTEILGLQKDKLRSIRGNEIATVFQNPAGFLNPTRKIRKHFIETVRSHEKTSKIDACSRALSIFEKLDLKDGKRILDSYPFELSGGMNQRVAIALSMVLEPDLLLADEPTSALDLTIQDQVIDEFLRLRDVLGTAIVIVTHNMGVVAKAADRVGVVYDGEIVEIGDANKILKDPLHPYTIGLMDSVPTYKNKKIKSIPLKNDDVKRPVEGCRFAPRCTYASERCFKEKQILRKNQEDHYCRCMRVEEINVNK
ncbi:ABC transporter ATP-binding protein [Alkalibacter mobilis]|uniref:ABC transporter ATP-binding protein n=1 Tax=Alkalibacter mobilis TaxID=2787712 RepID=UPI0018A0DC6A|nr:ABC transporter ATP-binding protein [Alkalibacter mobilis]MBF7096243.1 ABC transporter ATP-binding protein [Alkalibacter mobilis]